MTLGDLFRADREDISSFESNDDYMRYSVELYKEFFTFFNAVLCIDSICEKRLDKKKGILFGLLRKLGDISLNYLNLLCNGSIDSIFILGRTSYEVMVTALLMLNHYEDDSIFSDYIKYSLITEKRFYELLEKDDENLDFQELKLMRERMKKSIKSSFDNSGFTVEELDIKHEQKNNFWCKTKIYERFEKVGFSRVYQIYRLACHATHGNWQSLDKNFISHNSNGEIEINYEKNHAKPQLVLPYIILHSEVLLKIIEKFGESFEHKEILVEYMDSCLDEVTTLDKAHEVFLQKHGNHSH